MQISVTIPSNRYTLPSPEQNLPFDMSPSKTIKNSFQIKHISPIRLSNNLSTNPLNKSKSQKTDKYVSEIYKFQQEVMKKKSQNTRLKVHSLDLKPKDTRKIGQARLIGKQQLVNLLTFKTSLMNKSDGISFSRLQLFSLKGSGSDNQIEKGVVKINSNATSKLAEVQQKVRNLDAEIAKKKVDEKIKKSYDNRLVIEGHNGVYSSKNQSTQARKWNQQRQSDKLNLGPQKKNGTRISEEGGRINNLGIDSFDKKTVLRRWQFNFVRRLNQKAVNEDKHIQLITSKVKKQIGKYQFFSQERQKEKILDIKLRERIKSDMDGQNVKKKLERGEGRDQKRQKSGVRIAMQQLELQPQNIYPPIHHQFAGSYTLTKFGEKKKKTLRLGACQGVGLR